MLSEVWKNEKEVNNFLCRPSDYFEGTINEKGKPVSKFYGTYCGFINFDNVRYWDGRYIQGVKIKLEEKPLESDFRNRDDLKRLQ